MALLESALEKPTEELRNLLLKNGFALVAVFEAREGILEVESACLVLRIFSIFSCKDDFLTEPEVGLSLDALSLLLCLYYCILEECLGGAVDP